MAGGSYSGKQSTAIHGQPERNVGGHGRQCEWCDRGDGDVYASGGGAESGDGDGDGYAGDRGGSGIGFSDCGGADGSGRVAGYGDGDGRGWGAARGCCDADGTVGRSHRRDAEGAEKKLLQEWGADIMSALFFLRHIPLFLRHGEVSVL